MADSQRIINHPHRMTCTGSKSKVGVDEDAVDDDDNNRNNINYK